ncbi:cupin domain-containing protein [Sporosarcina limicola]|uniref:Cupin superfamily sugar epimerase n=1 Tax=Sporosarcina limicola TaxID=34101 RepID=A0A927MIT3_9BACL|nr:cupin domain-containing protein [Sporosarcina limicola]MBE1555440.1 putative cupin superfamily sugar epimerase [Sporosarcina limicola]
MIKVANYYIQHLGLEPHPEGGHFARSIESAEEMDVRGEKRKLFSSI